MNVKAKNPKFGDIYLVKFHPSQGKGLKKFRPAVVVSTKINLLFPDYTLISPLTSQIQSNSPTDLELTISNKCLDKKSAILAWYVRTVDTNRLSKKLGTLSPALQSKLKHTLAQLFT